MSNLIHFPAPIGPDARLLNMLSVATKRELLRAMALAYLDDQFAKREARRENEAGPTDPAAEMAERVERNRRRLEADARMSQYRSRLHAELVELSAKPLSRRAYLRQVCQRSAALRQEIGVTGGAAVGGPDVDWPRAVELARAAGVEAGGATVEWVKEHYPEALP